jgi:hypothetical protein
MTGAEWQQGVVNAAKFEADETAGMTHACPLGQIIVSSSWSRRTSAKGTKSKMRPELTCSLSLYGADPNYHRLRICSVGDGG